jgi:hypothetical protein
MVNNGVAGIAGNPRTRFIAAALSEPRGRSLDE